MIAHNNNDITNGMEYKAVCKTMKKHLEQAKHKSNKANESIPLTVFHIIQKLIIFVQKATPREWCKAYLLPVLRLQLHYPTITCLIIQLCELLHISSGNVVKGSKFLKRDSMGKDNFAR
jgi:hypothetical protein